MISADKITCGASNVDITDHSCDLVFGKKTVILMGRRAHELYATLAEIGVQANGAAGSTFEALSNLKCAIKPSEVQQRGAARTATILRQTSGNGRFRSETAIATPLVPAYLIG